MIWKHYLRCPQEFCSPEIQQEVIIGAYVTVDAGKYRSTYIGAGTLVMKHAHVGHDTVIGQGCEIGAGAVIGGECMIGNNVQIGLNACVKSLVTIGAGARIGAGAVVICDIPAGEVWAGNPAKQLTSGREAQARGQATVCDRCPNDTRCPPCLYDDQVRANQEASCGSHGDVVGDEWMQWYYSWHDAGA